MRRSARLNSREDYESGVPTPPPKKQKRLGPKERPRPQFSYELLNNMPVTEEFPDYDRLERPLSFEESQSLAYALHVSRTNWLTGVAFETCWTRKPRGKKLSDTELSMRDKMSKLCECTIVTGIHRFPAKLFMIREEEDAPANASANGASSSSDQGPRSPQQGQTPSDNPNNNTATSGPSGPGNANDANSATTGSAAPTGKQSESPGKGADNATLSAKDNNTADQTSSSETATAKPEDAVPAASSQPAQLPPPPPPPQSQDANQLIVYRLQQMAQRDPSLSQLMKEVASGNASPTTVARFQTYINRAKAMDGPKKQYQTYRKVLKSLSLAFEFDENPAERYLLPRDSITEVLPNESMLISFLQTSDSIGGKVYRPTTITLENVSSRYMPTVERCFEEPEKVKEHMKEIMEKHQRESDFHVWYQIEKHDAALIDEIKKMQPPQVAVAPIKRTYKKTKTRDDMPRTKYPTVLASSPQPQQRRHSTSPTRIKEPSSESGVSNVSEPPRAKLNLPDPKTFQIPPEGLPPLPPSLRNIGIFRQGASTSQKSTEQTSTDTHTADTGKNS